jgi:hypothetical protein
LTLLWTAAAADTSEDDVQRSLLRFAVQAQEHQRANLLVDVKPLRLQSLLWWDAEQVALNFWRGVEVERAQPRDPVAGEEVLTPRLKTRWKVIRPRSARVGKRISPNA